MGLLPDTENQVEVVINSQRGERIAKTLAIATRMTTDSLDSCRDCYPTIELTIGDPTRMEPGWTLVELVGFDDAKQQQIKRIQLLKSGAMLPAPPDFWANSFFLSWFKRNATPQELGVIRSRLESVYQLDRWLWQQAGPRSQINPTAHGTSVADGLQLCYLSSPDHYFLTTDRRLKEHVSASSQSSQILLWADLEKSLTR